MQKLLTIVLIYGFLAACGSGGGSGDTPSNSGASTIQVGGVVVAPSGIIAKSNSNGFFRWFASLVGFPDTAIAQAQGLSAVQNARIFLINVDNTGRPIGAPLATSNTDANGFFVLTVPSGTNMAPAGSTLTVIQAATANTSGPVPIGTAGVLNVPAVQPFMLVDPAGELGTRRMITAGVSRFSMSSAAGYVGLLQALLDQVPSLVGNSITSTITNIENHFSYQSEVLPVLLDIENTGQGNQGLVDGTYGLFEYHTYPDDTSTPFHRTTGHGDVTFDPAAGTITVNSNEFGGSLKEDCATLCTRTFTLQLFQDQTSGAEGLFYRTATNRVIFSAPGIYSFIAQMNATGTLGIFTLKSSDGEQSIGMLVKRGTSISGADFAATFNYVDFGSILNQSVRNQPVVTGTSWAGILQSRSGAGTLTLVGGNSPVGFLGVTNGESTSHQQVNCAPSGGGCTISATLSALLPTSGTPRVGIPFTVLSNGAMVLSGIGSGGMSSDRSLYVATLTDTLFPADISFSVVLRPATTMTAANLSGTYRIITLEDNLTSAAQVNTRLLTGTAQFNGAGSSTFSMLAGQASRAESCVSGICGINTTITGASPPTSETRNYTVSSTGVLTFSGGNIPTGATVSGGVTQDASFFIIQAQVDNVVGVSTRSITLGIRTP